MWQQITRYKSNRISLLLLVLFLTLQASVLTLRGQQPKLKDQIQFSAEYQIEKGTNSGVILLTADIKSGNYIYALKQPNKEINPSRISIKQSDSFSHQPFVPNVEPILVKNDPVFRTDLAKHKGKVIFWAPLKLDDGRTADSLTIEMMFNGSVCTEKGMCFPIRNKPVRVAFGGYYESKQAKNR